MPAVDAQNSSREPPEVWRDLPPHLAVRNAGAAGRGLFATTDVEAGFAALSAPVIQISLARSYSSSTCRSCLQSTPDEEQLPLCCKGCESLFFCSPACMASHTVQECQILQATAGDKNINKLEQGYINSLASMVGVLATCDDPIGRLQQVLTLVRSGQWRRGSARNVSAAKAAASRVSKLVAEYDEGILLHALLAAELNDIGIFNYEGDEIGKMSAPQFAISNHSCLPNCAYTIHGGKPTLTALRPIAAGEQLTQSYVHLNCDGSERKAAIRDSWEFDCLCPRCRVGGDDSKQVAAFDEAHKCECGRVVLVAVGECQCNVGSLCL
mmetsp:Transcript_9994/g.26465  ORF Transcript_9994/g.26465 Transcript_9994/m.26465 type:complete len:325 (+) Transcript_9994:50-1024(+)